MRLCYGLLSSINLPRITIFTLLIFISLLAGCGNVADDENISVLSAEGALIKDAQEYSKELGVPINEAVRRLELQDAIGVLDSELSASSPDTYAGLWIQHSPTFRVIVNTTGENKDIFSKVTDKSLTSLIEVQKADKTLQQLKAEQLRSLNTMHGLNIEANAGINVFDNRAELYVTDALAQNKLQADLKVSDNVKVLRISDLGGPDAGNLYGGIAISVCTAGFIVRSKEDNRIGVSTAAHCPDYQYWGDGPSSIALNFVESAYGSEFDVQWNVPASSQSKLKPWAKDDTCNDSTPCYRVITGVTNRSQQPINSWVCSFGRTSGFRCGYIKDRTYAPFWIGGATPSWVRVSRAGVTLSKGGDSGGPWYKGGSAWGITQGHIGKDAVYMAINYIDGIKIRVETGR